MRSWPFKNKSHTKHTKHTNHTTPHTMTTAEFKAAIEQFTLPLNRFEIDWKIQSKKNNTIVVPYIDNRAAQMRLDECFGPQNWTNSFERWGNAKGVKCGISVRIEGVWVTKYDGADESDIEPTKGGFSDSMKRACTQWGLGRDLYDYPRVMFKGEVGFLKPDMVERCRMVTDDFLANRCRDLYMFEADAPRIPAARVETAAFDYGSVEGIKAAYKAGIITKEQAVAYNESLIKK